MLPLRDHNPTRRTPVITILLILANVGVFFLVQPSAESLLGAPTRQAAIDDLEFNLQYAAVPCEVVTGRPLTQEEIRQTFVEGETTACGEGGASTPFPGKQVWLAVLYSMFLHGGLLHLAGNMLFLWIFGNNIEDHLGPVRYALFYLLSGLAATAAHVVVQPDSSVPVVGASGAIAGIMGAYLVWFPNTPVLTVFFFFFILFREISAKWLLGFWFVSQFFLNPNEGVAWVAHVGGFVFGVAIGLVVRISRAARRALWRSRYTSVSSDPW